MTSMGTIFTDELSKRKSSYSGLFWPLQTDKIFAQWIEEKSLNPADTGQYTQQTLNIEKREKLYFE